MTEQKDWPDYNKKRVGNLIICKAGTCGNTKKGAYPIPADEFKDTINKKGFKKQFKVSVSECLGVCKPHNVSTVLTKDKQYWFGMFRSKEAYDDLLDWIIKSSEKGEMLELPKSLEKYSFERY